jgi:hypothetical protein
MNATECSNYGKGAPHTASNCDVFLAIAVTPPISVYLFRIVCPGGGEELGDAQQTHI